MVCTLEQRNAHRTEVDWPISVWHPQLGRFFNGHSINVSRTGAFIELPLKAPLREGQELEINFPRRENLAQKKGSCARIKAARVIRVDRSNAIMSAAVKVALAFENNE